MSCFALVQFLKRQRLLTFIGSLSGKGLYVLASKNRLSWNSFSLVP